MLTRTAGLIVSKVPIPTTVSVGGYRLARVNDDKLFLVSEIVELGISCNNRRRLAASMENNDKGHRLIGRIILGSIHVVIPRAVGARICVCSRCTSAIPHRITAGVSEPGSQKGGN